MKHRRDIRVTQRYRFDVRAMKKLVGSNPSAEPTRDTRRAMSQANVEIVRRYYERLNARDTDGCLELLAPDIEIAQPDL